MLLFPLVGGGGGVEVNMYDPKLFGGRAEPVRASTEAMYVENFCYEEASRVLLMVSSTGF